MVRSSKVSKSETLSWEALGALWRHFRVFTTCENYYQQYTNNYINYWYILFIFFIQQVLISHPFYTHQCIHVNPNFPNHPTTTTPPLSPLGVRTFVLYNCVSISALQTGSSVPFFQIPHIRVNIRYVCFSFWLTSVCMTVSRSIHVTRNNSTSFLF